jgi:hypothetical protein
MAGYMKKLKLLNKPDFVSVQMDEDSKERTTIHSLPQPSEDKMDCDVHFHVECARKAGLNLIPNSEDVYCNFHLQFYRKQTICLLNAAKEFEVREFA